MSPSRRRRRASPEWEGRPAITVATLPGRGLYSRHLSHPEGVDGVHRVTVSPTGSGKAPAAFDIGWLEAHLHQVDVLEVLGVPRRHDVADVRKAIEATKEAGKPLVFTGYHLSDPNGVDDGRYGAQLDELVPNADAVVTLTETAAAEMGRRWNVSPSVLPHPHAVDFVRMRRPHPPRSSQLVVGVHLASLRGTTDPVELTRSLCSAARQVGDVRLVVSLHENVLDAGSAAYDPTAARAISEAVHEVGGTVRAHRPFGEAELWDHIYSLDVCVVPGLHGSHSIWPEACYDLGTHAVVPSGSHAAGQRPCLQYDVDRHGRPTVASLVRALRCARDGQAAKADPGARWNERVQVGESLRSTYERLSGIGLR